MGTEETTNCIVCGRDGGYHRAVVDVVEERVVGALCRECEREEFGRTLDRGFFEAREGCALCDRDGHVAIPIWRPVARTTDDGAVINEVTFAVDEATVRLCDEHVAAIAEEFPATRRRPVPSR
ncbi:MAG: hypothetical protein ACQEQY_10390 [Halobacteriota archaeon]